MPSSKRGAVALLAAVMGLVACQGTEPTQGSKAALMVAASPRVIDDKGQVSTLTLTAVTADGRLGEGSVVVSAEAGALEGLVDGAVTLQQGKAHLTFACDVRQDPGCAGSVRIEAQWQGITTATGITVGLQSPGGTDAGTQEPPADAGSGADGGDTGSSTTTDGGMTLESDRSQLVGNTGDRALITATATLAPGVPAPGETIVFQSAAGDLMELAGGPVAHTLTRTTDAQGRAQVYLYGGTAVDTVDVTATRTANDDVARLTLQVRRVQQISWVYTRCFGQDCTVMGIKGSGFNEQAQVAFKVVDPMGRPLSNVKVLFSINFPPTGTKVSAEGLTDLDGVAVANVVAGPVPGAVNIYAKVDGTDVSTFSPTIGVRGAKAANHAFSFKCSPSNVDAFNDALPPKQRFVECKVKLVDRFNNPVGTGTSVNFKVEAGSMPNAIATTPYNPGGVNGDEGGEGTAIEFFDTRGALPVDVDALLADSSQYPGPRDDEPKVNDGFLVRNPRDGLVTLIAYVRGEEYFDDTNANGKWDPTERCVDQGEAFVDENDDGTWNQGEFYIDDSPSNGVWDPPNGTCDDDRTIWTETRVLYTGAPVADTTHSFMAPNPFATACADGQWVPRGGSVMTYVSFMDENLNRPDGSVFELFAPSTLWSVSRTIPDGFGFGYDRVLVDASTGKACTGTSLRCEWKVLFFGWDRGRLQRNPVTIFGRDLEDPDTSCVQDSVTVYLRTIDPLVGFAVPVTGRGYYE